MIHYYQHNNQVWVKQQNHALVINRLGWIARWKGEIPAPEVSKERALQTIKPSATLARNAIQHGPKAVTKELATGKLALHTFGSASLVCPKV